MKASQKKPTELWRCSVCETIYEREDLVPSSRTPNALVPPCNEPREWCKARPLCVPARDNDGASDIYIARSSLDELYDQARRGAALQRWAEESGIKLPQERMVFRPCDRAPVDVSVTLQAERAATRADVLMLNETWPLPDIVRKLAEAAAHLLGHHSCDQHGYEEVQIAMTRARAWLTKIGYCDTSPRPFGQPHHELPKVPQ